MSNRLAAAITALDAANAADPNKIVVDGRARPAEVVYAERMSAWLARLYPEASEALEIAVRAQHLKRWTVPRGAFPMTRAGYHQWRNTMKARHAEWTCEIIAPLGFNAAECQRIGALVRKENLNSDPEARALEDVACLVFLEHYAADFAEKHDDEKLSGILTKTWAKMTDRGRRAALGLALPPRLSALLAPMVAALEKDVRS